jgi:hypothetical protein
MPLRIQTLWREPLLHFVLIGAALFLFYDFVGRGDSEVPTPKRIIVSSGQVEQLVANFERTWSRPPTLKELDALVEGHVREEVFYREALSLGLDRNDAVVRRRLRQKMEFLTDTAADILEPTVGELEAYLAANAQTYRSGPQLAFEQIYLGETPDPDSVTLSLKALRIDPVADPTALGKSTLLPARLDLSPPQAVDGMFGQGFFERVAEVSPGAWAGPVDSAYGVHLVRVLDSQSARMPRLEDVRAAVLRDWKAAKTQEIRESYYAQLRERYVVEIKGADVRTAETR